MPPQVFNIPEGNMNCKGFVTSVSGHSDKNCEEGSKIWAPFCAVQCRMGLTLAEKLITLLEAWVSHDPVEAAISSRKQQQDVEASPTNPP